MEISKNVGWDNCKGANVLWTGISTDRSSMIVNMLCGSVSGLGVPLV